MEKIGGALSRKRTNLPNYYHHNMIICASPEKKDSLLPHSADSAEYLILQRYKNKMAARTSKRSRERQVPYKIRNDLSSVDLFYEEKSKRKRTLNKSLGIFMAERNCNPSHLLLNKEKM